MAIKLNLDKAGYAEASLSYQNTPPLSQTEWQNPVQKAAFIQRNCQTESKTKKYLRKLKKDPYFEL